MHDVPGWLSAGIAAMLGFAATWGAVRATLAKQSGEIINLQRELHELRRELGPLLMVAAEVKGLSSEVQRLRDASHRQANEVQVLIARLAVVEDRQGATGKHRRMTGDE